MNDTLAQLDMVKIHIKLINFYLFEQKAIMMKIISGQNASK